MDGDSSTLTGEIHRCRFEPCEWSDLSCHALVDIAAVSGTPLRGIVGHHKNAGTWLKGYGEAEPSPLSLKLRLRLRADTWATLVCAVPSSFSAAQWPTSCASWPQTTSKRHPRAWSEGHAIGGEPCSHGGSAGI